MKANLTLNSTISDGNHSILPPHSLLNSFSDKLPLNSSDSSIRSSHLGTSTQNSAPLLFPMQGSVTVNSDHPDQSDQSDQSDCLIECGLYNQHQRQPTLFMTNSQAPKLSSHLSSMEGPIQPTKRVSQIPPVYSDDSKMDPQNDHSDSEFNIQRLQRKSIQSITSLSSTIISPHRQKANHHPKFPPYSSHDSNAITAQDDNIIDNNVLDTVTDFELVNTNQQPQHLSNLNVLTNLPTLHQSHQPLSHHVVCTSSPTTCTISSHKPLQSSNYHATITCPSSTSLTQLGRRLINTSFLLPIYHHLVGQVDLGPLGPQLSLYLNVKDTPANNLSTVIDLLQSICPGTQVNVTTLPHADPALSLTTALSPATCIGQTWFKSDDPSDTLTLESAYTLAQAAIIPASPTHGFVATIRASDKFIKDIEPQMTAFFTSYPAQLCCLFLQLDLGDGRQRQWELSLYFETGPLLSTEQAATALLLHITSPYPNVTVVCRSVDLSLREWVLQQRFFRTGTGLVQRYQFVGNSSHLEQIYKNFESSLQPSFSPLAFTAQIIGDAIWTRAAYMKRLLTPLVNNTLDAFAIAPGIDGALLVYIETSDIRLPDKHWVASLFRGILGPGCQISVKQEDYSNRNAILLSFFTPETCSEAPEFKPVASFHAWDAKYGKHLFAAQQKLSTLPLNQQQSKRYPTSHLALASSSSPQVYINTAKGKKSSITPSLLQQFPNKNLCPDFFLPPSHFPQRYPPLLAALQERINSLQYPSHRQELDLTAPLSPKDRQTSSQCFIGTISGEYNVSGAEFLSKLALLKHNESPKLPISGIIFQLEKIPYPITGDVLNNAATRMRFYIELQTPHLVEEVSRFMSNHVGCPVYIKLATQIREVHLAASMRIDLRIDGPWALGSCVPASNPEHNWQLISKLLENMTTSFNHDVDTLQLSLALQQQELEKYHNPFSQILRQKLPLQAFPLLKYSNQPFTQNQQRYYQQNHPKNQPQSLKLHDLTLFRSNLNLPDSQTLSLDPPHFIPQQSDLIKKDTNRNKRPRKDFYHTHSPITSSLPQIHDSDSSFFENDVETIIPPCLGPTRRLAWKNHPSTNDQSLVSLLPLTDNNSKNISPMLTSKPLPQIQQHLHTHCMTLQSVTQHQPAPKTISNTLNQHEPLRPPPNAHKLSTLSQSRGSPSSITTSTLVSTTPNALLPIEAWRTSPPKSALTDPVMCSHYRLTIRCPGMDYQRFFNRLTTQNKAHLIRNMALQVMLNPTTGPFAVLFVEVPVGPSSTEDGVLEMVQPFTAFREGDYEGEEDEVEMTCEILYFQPLWPAVRAVLDPDLCVGGPWFRSFDESNYLRNSWDTERKATPQQIAQTEHAYTATIYAPAKTINTIEANIQRRFVRYPIYLRAFVSQLFYRSVGEEPHILIYFETGSAVANVAAAEAFLKLFLTEEGSTVICEKVSLSSKSRSISNIVKKSLPVKFICENVVIGGDISQLSHIYDLEKAKIEPNSPTVAFQVFVEPSDIDYRKSSLKSALGGMYAVTNPHPFSALIMQVDNVTQNPLPAKTTTTFATSMTMYIETGDPRFRDEKSVIGVIKRFVGDNVTVKCQQVNLEARDLIIANSFDTSAIDGPTFKPTSLHAIWEAGKHQTKIIPDSYANNDLQNTNITNNNPLLESRVVTRPSRVRQPPTISNLAIPQPNLKLLANKDIVKYNTNAAYVAIITVHNSSQHINAIEAVLDAYSDSEKEFPQGVCRSLKKVVSQVYTVPKTTRDGVHPPKLSAQFLIYFETRPTFYSAPDALNELIYDQFNLTALDTLVITPVASVENFEDAVALITSTNQDQRTLREPWGRTEFKKQYASQVKKVRNNTYSKRKQ